MPYSTAQRCVFIHIPKVAGTAIIDALEINQEGPHGEFMRLGHMKWQDYTWLGSFFSFAFVRHPVSRFIAAYNYARLEESYYHKVGTATQHGDYVIFMQNNINQIVEMVVNSASFSHDSETFVSQHEFICYHGEPRVHFIGRFEHIQQDFAVVCRVLNKAVVTLPVINYSSDENADLTKESARKIEAFYEEDMKLFGYQPWKFETTEDREEGRGYGDLT